MFIYSCCSFISTSNISQHDYISPSSHIYHSLSIHISSYNKLTSSGPIIRISPHQLHVYDPVFYEELYSQHKVRHKYAYFLDRFQLPGSAFGSVDHKLHRERRAALNKYLSKQTIKKLEPMLLDMLDKLCGRIEEFREKGEKLDMRIVYQCFSTDVITLVCLLLCCLECFISSIYTLTSSRNSK